MDGIARRLCEEWLGESRLVPIAHAMNSLAWRVDAGGACYVLKISSRSAEPGLRVAGWLDEHGFRAGGPLRTAVVDDQLAALLRFVEGRPLTRADRDAIGETLGHVHRVLVTAPVPDGIARWPWRWLDPSIIEEPRLRAAATGAITRAQLLAPRLTHGVLHGDPAPEAFREAGGDIGLIDWGASCHGPLLYDVASAWMYTDARIVEAYASTGPLDRTELEHAPALLALRWAVQASYFSGRLASNDLTGIASREENQKGLADARAALIS